MENPPRRDDPTQVIGIDHIYLASSDLSRSEAFYDRVLLDVLGFRKSRRKARFRAVGIDFAQAGFEPAGWHTESQFISSSEVTRSSTTLP